MFKFLYYIIPTILVSLISESVFSSSYNKLFNNPFFLLLFLIWLFLLIINAHRKVSYSRSKLYTYLFLIFFGITQVIVISNSLGKVTFLFWTLTCSYLAYYEFYKLKK